MADNPTKLARLTPEAADAVAPFTSAASARAPGKSRGKRPAQLSNKDSYRALCREEASIPLCSRDWWLDAAVGPEAWDVAVVKKDTEIVATMPYVLRRRMGMQLITQPALTPTLGPWLRAERWKPATRMTNEKELMQALIDQLPPFDYMVQTWNPSITNWQPFFWNGFQQTTLYTYVLPDLTDTDALWSGLQSDVRRAIGRATSQYGLQIRDDLPLDDLLALNRKTFERQGISPPYSDAFVRRLDAACAERGCRKFFIAVDSAGAHHAGWYIVWDEHSSYGLIAGADPALRQSGASSLCVWSAIKHAAGVTRQFNFSGSMIEPFERYLRNFGGIQVPYFHVSKTRSRLLLLRQGLLSLMGKK